MTDYCSFHIEISRCDVPRARPHSNTVTNLYVKTVEERIPCLTLYIQPDRERVNVVRFEHSGMGG